MSTRTCRIFRLTLFAIRPGVRIFRFYSGKNIHNKRLLQFVKDPSRILSKSLWNHSFKHYIVNKETPITETALNAPKPITATVDPGEQADQGRREDDRHHDTCDLRIFGEIDLLELIVREVESLELHEVSDLTPPTLALGIRFLKTSVSSGAHIRRQIRVVELVLGHCPASACRPQPLAAVFRLAHSEPPRIPNLVYSSILLLTRAPSRKAHESVLLSSFAAALLSVLCGFHFDIVTYKLLLGVFGQTDYLDRYIAKSYFEQYGTLVKEEFDSFIANEIPLGLSHAIEDENYILPKLSSLHRHVIGEGSHRHLSTSIRFKLQHKLKSHLTAQSCEVIIIERLPSGVFSDPFELQHLVKRGVFTDVAVFGDTNLELPAFRSNQSLVEIHMSITSKVLSRTEDDDSEVNLELPLHARYQKPKSDFHPLLDKIVPKLLSSCSSDIGKLPLGHGFSRVEFGQPDVFICCGLKLKVPDMNCMPLPISDILQNTVIWEIPCGSHEHAGLVSAVTFGFAIVAAMIIVLMSVCYSDGQASSKSKLS
ncbi:hypothetical protein STAS_27894 [Striga asiatica]|uniref:Phosphatidylinositol-glycan biosynthesis class X protein n=1 Tax=Striga asiatica TaxID=4170 RepID=A0A5A7QYV2_STRAF|nr:hypothetical protein STAS_27894 [Striga asiatica]